MQRAAVLGSHRERHDDDQRGGDNNGNERSISHVQRLQRVFHLKVEATRIEQKYVRASSD
jgi:hypothetical protein